MNLRLVFCAILLIHFNVYSREKEELLPFYARYIRSMYGQKKLSAENEQLIRDIAQAMGIDHPIYVFRLNTQMLWKFGLDNAFAYIDHIYFGEFSLNELTLEQKRFLIAHELAHVKNKHVQKKMIWQALDTSLVFGGMFLLFRSQGYHEMIGGTIAMLTTLFPLRRYIHAYISRQYEREADVAAVQFTQSKQPAIEFLQLLNTKERQKTYNSWLNRLFITHPSTEERIKYITELMLSENDTN